MWIRTMQVTSQHVTAAASLLTFIAAALVLPVSWLCVLALAAGGLWWTLSQHLATLRAEELLSQAEEQEKALLTEALSREASQVAAAVARKGRKAGKRSASARRPQQARKGKASGAADDSDSDSEDERAVLRRMAGLARGGAAAGPRVKKDRSKEELWKEWSKMNAKEQMKAFAAAT